jgi:uncharacterized protein
MNVWARGVTFMFFATASLAAASLAATSFASAGLAAAGAETAPHCSGKDLSMDPTVKPRYEAFADDLMNGDGLLWEIQKDGVAPSYLFGTIHSTQPGPLELAREAALKLDGAKSVATELGGPFDAQAKINMTSALLSAALSPDSDTFAGRLSADEAVTAERFLAAHGFTAEMAHHLKLWFLAVASTLPECEGQGESRGLPEVDDTIARIAQSRGLPVVALESIDEQAAAVSATPPDLAAHMLIASARAPELDDDAYVTLLNLYLRKQPALATAVLDAAPGVDDEDRAAERDFTKLLLVSRNETMAQRAAPLVAKGGAFIAVGALHLSGKDGLVERYRNMGYSVTKVW